MKKPQYKKTLKYTNPLHGEVIINGYFTYEILISEENYQAMFTTKNSEFIKIIGQEIIGSLNNLDVLSKKKLDFDIDKFKSKITGFFGDDESKKAK